MSYRNMESLKIFGEKFAMLYNIFYHTKINNYIEEKLFLLINKESLIF
jgi:hypothetical protein